MADSTARVSARVTRTIDSDTIEIEIEGCSFTVRYIGVDTPKTVAPGRPVEPYHGREATEANRRLVEGKTVQLATWRCSARVSP